MAKQVPRPSIRKMGQEAGVSKSTIDNILNSNHYYDKHPPKNGEPKEEPTPPPIIHPDNRDAVPNPPNAFRAPCGHLVYSLPCWQCYIAYEQDLIGPLTSTDPALSYNPQASKIEVGEEELLTRIAQASLAKKAHPEEMITPSTFSNP